MGYILRDYDIFGQTLGIRDVVGWYQGSTFVEGIILREQVLPGPETAAHLRYPFQRSGWQEDTFLFYEVLAGDRRVLKFGSDLQLIQKAPQQRRLF